MSEWNMEKVHKECLKLMGFTRALAECLGTNATSDMWIGPDEHQYLDSDRWNGLPDPTTSLDDALPLLTHNNGTFISIMPTDDGEAFQARSGPFTRIDANPALAVCLLRLELEGRTLDDFRVKP